LKGLAREEGQEGRDDGWWNRMEMETEMGDGNDGRYGAVGIDDDRWLLRATMLI